MMDISFLQINFHGVNNLFIARRSKGCDGQSLCFAAGEQSAAVSSWQNTDLAVNVADFIQFSAIWSLVLFQNILMDNFIGSFFKTCSATSFSLSTSSFLYFSSIKLLIFSFISPIFSSITCLSLW